MAYTEIESGDCILLTFDPEREHTSVSIRDRGVSGKSCTVNTITQKQFRMQNPGTWELTDAGILIGIRKNETKFVDKVAKDYTPSGMRRRGAGLPAAKKRVHWHVDSDEDSWEVWSLSSKGERATIPLCNTEDTINENDSHLLVTNLGPMTKVGRRSIGVVLGNVIKIITVGHERFDNGDETLEDVSSMTLASRKRRTVGTRRGSGI